MVHRGDPRLIARNIGASHDACAARAAGQHDHACRRRVRARSNTGQRRVRCKDHHSPHPPGRTQVCAMERTQLRAVEVNAAGWRSALDGRQRLIGALVDLVTSWVNAAGWIRVRGHEIWVDHACGWTTICACLALTHRREATVDVHSPERLNDLHANRISWIVGLSSCWHGRQGDENCDDRTKLYSH